MPRRVLHLRARDVWHDGRRRATIVGGDDTHIQVRIYGELREYNLRYFARKFSPVNGRRHREEGSIWRTCA